MLDELVARVLADRLEHANPWLRVGALGDSEQAGVDQLADGVEWIRVAAGCGHGRDGVQVRAAGENAELAEEPLLALVEQLV